LENKSTFTLVIKKVALGFIKSLKRR